MLKRDDVFRDFLTEVEPIRVREPLAETLGAFNRKDAVLEYTFTDAVKMAGHACPTVASAFLCCQRALGELYKGEIPERGGVSITVYGEQDDGVYGVIGQVLSFLTGAAPASGFKGLGHRFRRKDLLKYTAEKIDKEALCIEFRRLDNNKTVLVKLYPRRIQFPHEKEKRLGELMEKVVWEAAKDAEKKEFQDLWTEKVKNMLQDGKDSGEWIKLERR